MWERSLLTLGTTQGGAAVFDPQFSLAQIEAMGMGCLRIDENGVVLPEEGVVEIQVNVCHIRRFYRRFDFITGACDGAKTAYLFVEYVNSGPVHGWPASEACLKKKGAQI